MRGRIPDNNLGLSKADAEIGMMTPRANFMAPLPGSTRRHLASGATSFMTEYTMPLNELLQEADRCSYELDKCDEIELGRLTEEARKLMNLTAMKVHEN